MPAVDRFSILCIERQKRFVAHSLDFRVDADGESALEAEEAIRVKVKTEADRALAVDGHLPTARKHALLWVPARNVGLMLADENASYPVVIGLGAEDRTAYSPGFEWTVRGQSVERCIARVESRIKKDMFVAAVEGHSVPGPALMFDLRTVHIHDLERTTPGLDSGLV